MNNFRFNRATPTFWLGFLAWVFGLVFLAWVFLAWVFGLGFFGLGFLVWVFLVWVFWSGFFAFFVRKSICSLGAWEANLREYSQFPFLKMSLVVVSTISISEILNLD